MSFIEDSRLSATSRVLKIDGWGLGGRSPVRKKPLRRFDGGVRNPLSPLDGASRDPAGAGMAGGDRPEARCGHPMVAR
jgi:hypothetical protein